MASLVYSDGYYANIGGHVFPMEKFALVRQYLLDAGVALEDDFTVPEPASDEDVLRVHKPDYVRKLKTGSLSHEEILTLELPFSPDLARASWLCAGGTIRACWLALDQGFAGNLAGGFHHAFPDHGEGFCVLNDIAIGIRAVLAAGRIDRAAIVDLDVHQGNGSAAIFADEPRVFTCSLHQERNYPLIKPPSDLDCGLPDGTTGSEYLAVLERALATTMATRPELLVYVAGADPYVGDQLGGLALTIEDLAARDERVFQAAASARVPVVVVLAGGYAVDVRDTVRIHAASMRRGLAQLEVFKP